MNTVKAFGQFVLGRFWDGVSSIFILTGELGRKIGSRKLCVFSGQKGHLACVKCMQHLNKALRLINREDLIK